MITIQKALKESIMFQTNKTDWLNDKLAEKGLLVSSHNSFNKYLGYNNLNYDISIRFIGNAKLKYNYLLIIIVDDINDFTPNNQIKKFLSKLSEKFAKQIYTIVSSRNEEEILFLTSLNGIDFIKSDTNGLKLFFKHINAQYIENIGVTKTVNKSINDNFQKWTRANLSMYITINDFDVVAIDSPKIFILELKRVEEDINTWLPYLDDYANYKACDVIIEDLGLDLNHFRTVAYNTNNENEIAICILTSIEKNKYKLFKEVSPFENLFKKPKYFESTFRRV